MQIIDNQKKFDEICKKLANEPVIYMDTEFYRRKTYYAKLCLVQIASKEDRIIIDILLIDDLTPLKDLLANNEVLKVFHAPEQDFDIFFHLFRKLPVNVFDTQLAAGVVGMEDVMGYSRLCKALLNINIDKTMQQANWQERPLSNELIDYAIKDVEYLIPLHRELLKTISDRNLWDTYISRSKKLLSVNNYKIRPEKFMKRMYLNGHPDEFKDRLLQFVMLREECAQDADLPRSFCISDKDLVQVCENLPTNEKELSRLYVRGKMVSKQKYKLKIFELCSGFKEF